MKLTKNQNITIAVAALILILFLLYMIAQNISIKFVDSLSPLYKIILAIIVFVILFGVEIIQIFELIKKSK